MAVRVGCLCLRRTRRRRGGRSRSDEERVTLPAVLGHRISSISGPSAGRCLTGVARGALASPSLCLGPSQNSQPGRWTQALRVPSRVMETPLAVWGWGNCSWLGRGAVVDFGDSPVRLSLLFVLFGVSVKKCRGHRSLSRRGSSNGASRC